MKKGRPPRTFRIRCYPVGGVIEIPVEARTADDAKRQACREVSAGLRMQPGGPTLFWGEHRRIHFIAVVAGEEACQQWPHEGGKTL